MIHNCCSKNDSQILFKNDTQTLLKNARKLRFENVQKKFLSRKPGTFMTLFDRKIATTSYETRLHH